MNKNLWMGLLLAAILVAVSGGAGYASMPSLLGPTGVVSTPNALVAPQGQLQVALDYQKLDTMGVDVYEEEFTRNEENNLWGFEALDGIFNRAELWAAYNKDSGDFEDKTWSAGFKYQLPLAPKSNVNLALGASYRKLSGSGPAILWLDPSDSNWLYQDQFDNDIRNWDVYLAATMDLTAMDSSCWCGSGKLLGTVGVIYKKLSFDTTDTWAEWFVGVPGMKSAPDWDPDYQGVDSWNVVDENLTRPFVSLEYFAPSRTSVGVEYRWKDDLLDVKPVFSAGLAPRVRRWLHRGRRHYQLGSAGLRPARPRLVRAARLHLRLQVAPLRKRLFSVDLRDGDRRPSFWPTGSQGNS